MSRSNQLGTPNGIPAAGHADQFTNGGGPAFVGNVFQGIVAAAAGAQDSAGVFTPSNATINATFTGEPRIGHEAALQQISRAADGTPMHIRADGPGLDGMDVPAFTTYPGQASLPAGSAQFKLHVIFEQDPAIVADCVRIVRNEPLVKIDVWGDEIDLANLGHPC